VPSPRAGGSADFRGWPPLITPQLECSLLERTSDGELIPMAEALGLGVLPWSPLRGGDGSGEDVVIGQYGDHLARADRSAVAIAPRDAGAAVHGG
jgi:aryl-alcohol dehydrogenase-like predicted oxidoreductase